MIIAGKARRKTMRTGGVGRTVQDGAHALATLASALPESELHQASHKRMGAMIIAEKKTSRAAKAPNGDHPHQLIVPRQGRQHRK